MSTILTATPTPSAVTSISGNSFNVSSLGTGSSEAALATDSNGPLLAAVSWTLTAIMLAAVLLRFYSRGFIIKMIGMEDWCIIPAALLSLAMAVVTEIGLQHGMGKHIWNVKKTHMQTLLKTVFLGNVTYLLSLAFIKVSLLFQLLRISVAQSGTRKVIIGIFTLAIIVSMVNVFLAIFRCLPVSYHWTRIIPGVEGHCLDFTVVVYTTSGLNIFMDILIWVVPMPLIWKLRLPRAQKFGLVAVMSLGGIVCAAAIARTEATYRLSNSKVASADNTYHQVEALCWSIAEANIAIICASLPPLRPLLKAIFPSVFGSLAASHDATSRGGPTDGRSYPLQSRDRSKRDLDYSSSTEELAGREYISVVKKVTMDPEQGSTQTGLGIAV